MPSLMRRLTPWQKVTAWWRPSGLPVSTKDWRLYPIPGRERGPGFGRVAAFWLCRRRSPSMPPISIWEHGDELCRSRPVRRLCCSDLVDDGRSVACLDRAAPGRGPLTSAAPRLAPRAVRSLGLHDYPLVHRPSYRTLCGVVM